MISEKIDLPDTMRVARYHGPGQPLRLESVPVPAIGDHAALDELKAGRIVGRAVLKP